MEMGRKDTGEKDGFASALIAHLIRTLEKSLGVGPHRSEHRLQAETGCDGRCT